MLHNGFIMPLGRALSRRERCRSCKEQVLRSFISTFIQSPDFTISENEISLDKLGCSVKRSKLSVLKYPMKRTTRYYFSKPQFSETAQLQSTVDQPPRNQELAPWYLQADNQTQIPKKSTSPLAERQKIPGLPPKSPPILDHLLQYVSADLGLDYLSIFDLRTVDPPPALGGNLIMVFGSARSPKHLNVSADRLCRWLRSNYKLSPFADGLLGRNELKLKLRRKSRRLKMLSTAGASEISTSDDGIATEWICVDVGVVESGASSPIHQEEDTGFQFTGFGSHSHGTKLIVQLLTENRREELGLEKVWREILNNFPEQRHDLHGQQQAAEAISASQPAEPSINCIADHRIINRSVSRQARHYHSTSKIFREPLPSPVASGSRASENASSTDTNHSEWEVSKKKVDFALSNGKPQRSQARSSFESMGDSNLQSGLEYLEDIPTSDAIQVLGEGEQDRSSTPFLRQFHERIPLFLEPIHWHWVIWLHCFAMKAGHPGYSLQGLNNLTRKAQASASCLLEETYVCILDCILRTPHHIHLTGFKSDLLKAENYALRHSLRLAFEILGNMEVIGHSPITDNLFSMLNEAITNPLFAIVSFQKAKKAKANDLRSVDHLDDFQGQENGYKETLYKHRVWSRKRTEIVFQDQKLLLEYLLSLHKAMLELTHIPRSNALLLEMLHSYADKGLWKAFWNLWHVIAQLTIARSSQMYFLMFHSVAITGDRAQCQKALLNWISEMQREAPAVKIQGSLAMAIRECLVVANVSRERSPLHEIWRQVETALDREALMESQQSSIPAILD